MKLSRRVGYGVIAGCLLVGCGPAIQRAPAPEAKDTPLSRMYQCAPSMPGKGGLVFDDNLLVVATSSAVFWLRLEESSTDAAVRLDQNISPYQSIDGVVGFREGLFAILPSTEGDCPVAVFSFDTIIDCWNAMDYAEVQFSQEGDQLVAASFGHLAVLKLEQLDAERKIWQLGPVFESSIRLVPGAMGRLAVFDPEPFPDESATERKPRRWIDPIAGADVVLPGVSLLNEDEAKVWVDQGHLFSESSKGIRDHGPLKAVRPVKASEDATALSPWSATRSDDKKTLVVKSIYQGGPTYSLKRSGRVWTQRTSFYGLHALYDDGEVYDLRTGKLALTFDLSEAHKGQFLIRTADGAVAGTEAIIVRRGLQNRVDTQKVHAAIRDVLRVSVAERQ